MALLTKTVGKKYTKDFKIYFTQGGKVVSPIHNIPLRAHDGLINVINEIPRFETGKFEMSTKLEKNPILQDTKNGKLRFYPNLFPMKGSIWNYGAIPQTWEDPNHEDEITKLLGDNDPLDVIEIGNVKKEIGELYNAKVLGAIGLIDSGETDYKILAIDRRDPLYEKINNADDIEKYKPNFIKETLRFFENYKFVTGGKKNSFYKNGAVLSVEITNEIIERAHEYWKTMKKSDAEFKIDENIDDSAKIEVDENADSFYFA